MVDLDFGVLTMAFGARKYIEQARTLALSLKINMPELKIALITDHPAPVTPFDKIVPLYPERGAGVIQKTWLDRYAPFQTTLFCDSDCVATRPFYDHLRALERFDFTPIMGNFLGPDDEDPFYFEDLGSTLRTLDLHKFAKFNGGIYYFTRGAVSAAVFGGARALAVRADELRLKSFDGGGAADETLIGLAMAQLGLDDLYFDDGALMRTPIGLSGRIHIDPLGGGCKFVKQGNRVEPAICHFATPYTRYADYAYTSFLVRHPKVPPWARRCVHLAARASARMANVYREGP